MRRAFRLIADLKARHYGWGPLCEGAPRFIERNMTLMRTIVRGAEDPKLLSLPHASFHGPFAVAFSSLPPVQLRPECSNKQESAHGAAVHQMYMVAAGSALASAGGGVGVRIACGDKGRPEKARPTRRAPCA